ncbi:unnamed protein product [Rotaria magnacalcarata]|nr:unnamed protein product [Rotaria magnacalcarata]
MAHAYSISSSSRSSPIFQFSSSISLLSARKQILLVFIGSSIIMFIVVLTMVLCFIDCVHKAAKEKKHNLAMTKANSISNNSSTPLTNTKHNFNSLSTEKKTFYKDSSSTNHYKSLIPTTKTKPITKISSSTSYSSSSIDSTTRANTAHNRAITNTFTYVALNTSDDFMPVDFDDNINSNVDDKRFELMMTTV